MLLDTSGLFCYLDHDDVRHGDAVTFYDAAAQRLTHNYVLAEFVPLAQARGLRRETALAFMAGVLDNPDVQVEWVDDVLHRAAVSLLQARLDKTYSVCDAVSFLLMEHYGITEALTTDYH